MNELLLEQVNPNGNVMAVVEATADTTYFYLHGAPESGFEMKALWICNHGPAPASLDVGAMTAGEPPSNPAPHCQNVNGRKPPTAGSLEIVWLPEGNGAALYEHGVLLAIIPPWSGQGGFDGYSRECVGEGPVAWELSEENVLRQRFEEARNYWTAWDTSDVWSDLQSALLADIESQLGPRSNYYAIDGGQWPPRALVRVPTDDGVAFLTIGLSLRPQPNVEMATNEPQDLRRIELGVLLPKEWPEEKLTRFAMYMSGQCTLPWTRYTWLGPGHTLPCDSWNNPDFQSVLCQHRHPALPEFSLRSQFGDPVHVLWLIPITADELEVAKSNGSES